MDIRVKERLIGGVLLVAVIVAFVPELLTGPHPLSNPTSGSEGALRTVTIDLEPPRGTAVSPDTTPDARSSDAGSTPNSQPAKTEIPAPTDPSSSADDAKSPEDLDGTVVAGSTAQPAATPPVEQAEPSPPPVEPAPRTATTKPAPSSGWAVQLGSFQSKQNADRLASELKQHGYRAFVSRHGSGKSLRYRVRVGPEEDRGGADALAARLKREGRQVSVVAYP